MEQALVESGVNVKISLCQNCNGLVRSAIESKMDRKAKNEFAKEVMQYNLSVKTISLEEFRKNEIGWCGCSD